MKLVVETVAPPPQPPPQKRYVLELTKEEVLVLRGLAFAGTSGRLNESITSVYRSFPTDGPKEASTYKTFLNRLWDETNNILHELR